MPVKMMKRRRPAKPPIAQQSGCLCVYLLLVSALGVTVCLWSLYSVARPSSHTPELPTPSVEGDGKQDPQDTVLSTSSEEREWKQLEQDHLKGELLEAKEEGLDVDLSAKAEDGSQTMYEKCRGRIHVIFSTVCNPYGDWQSEGLVYSHFKVGMRGTISRITSCNDEHYKYPKVWHPCYNVHVTKDLTGKVSTFNKAFAVKDWFDNGIGKDFSDDAIVVLLDADMIMLQNLDDPTLVTAGALARVAPGHPVSQLYWMGSSWLHKDKDLIEASGCGERCKVTDKIINENLQIGAPHFMAVLDWRKTAPLWASFSKAMGDKYAVFPWEGDMQCLNMALLYVGLFHEQTVLFMVSDPGARKDGEAWRLIGLDPPEPNLGDDPDHPPPEYVPNSTAVPILHYCQYNDLWKNKVEHTPGYSFGKYDYSGGFSFKVIAEGLFKCGTDGTFFHEAAPTMVQELWKAFKLHTPPGEPIGGGREAPLGQIKDRRRAWFIKVIPAHMNAALKNYRSKTCGQPTTVERFGVESVLGNKDAGAAPHAESVAATVPAITAQSTAVSEEAKPGILYRAIAGLKKPLPDGQKRERVAMAITVADDGPQMDGCAIVGYAMLHSHIESKYDIDLYAFVSPEAKRMQPILRELGYTVLERAVPVKVEELVNPTYREKAPTSGCCGLRELLKLEALTLTQYRKVLCLDMDSLPTQPLDELWDLDKPIIHTRDGHEREFLQGGFIMFQPDLAAYKGLLHVIRMGDFRYDGSGWEGSRIGFNYGGETIQGVVPFFFQKKMPTNSSLIVDMCVYNNMGDSDRCKAMEPTKVKNFHFTVCQKPWYCLNGRGLCDHAQGVWWKLRGDLEVHQLGVPRSERCYRKFFYEPIALPKQDPWLFRRVLNGCRDLPEKCFSF